MTAHEQPNVDPASEHPADPPIDPASLDPAWWTSVLPAAPTASSSSHTSEDTSPQDSDATSKDPNEANTPTEPQDPPDKPSREELLGPPEWANPEILFSELRALAAAAPPATLQQEALTAMVDASSAMLEPDDWGEPFRPMVELSDGTKSILPSDLDSHRLSLLAALARRMDHLPMRARVADVAWTYGFRSDSELLGIAVDAYLASPLECRAWHRLSKDAWRRGMQLILHRGKGEATRREAAISAITNRILEATPADGWMIIDLGDLLRQTGPPDKDTAQAVADHLIDLALQAGNSRQGRHLERTAQKFFHVLDDKPEVLASQVRVADWYVADAETRLKSGNASELAAGHFLEKAIATLKALPRAFRRSEGIEPRIEELRHLLDDNRQATLEAMVRIDSGSVDITQIVRDSETQVQGLPKFDALVQLAAIHPLADAEQTYAEARESLEGSLSRLFGRSTISADRRKVAACSGGGFGELDEHELFSAVLQRFTIRVDLVTEACIIPALQVVTFEHRFDLPFLRRLCWESPTVPQNHVDLWARGLWHGLKGDFPSAVSVLVPQAEQALRQSLKGLGVNTLTIDPESGVDGEKGLGALLAMDEATEFLGPNLLLEMRAMLVEKAGPNLRNDTAHGLLNDVAAWSHGAVYAWWLLMRLVVIPVWHMVAEAQQDQAGKHRSGDPEPTARLNEQQDLADWPRTQTWPPPSWLGQTLGRGADRAYVR